MTEELPSNPLSNKTILVTRPAGREKNLCQLIEQAGGHAIHYPVIKIQALDPLSDKQLKQLNIYNLAIFISKTAVDYSKAYFPYLSKNITIASIGSKTSKALKQHNLQVDIEAPEFNTESLLQLTQFQQSQMQKQQVIIFRGAGGRALLGDTLKQRGAEVHYIESYKRELPPGKPLTVQQLKDLDAITVSSNEGLDNLVRLVGCAELLTDIPLVLPSQRCITLAKQYGFKTIVRSQTATDEAVIKALIDYFSAQP